MRDRKNLNLVADKKLSENEIIMALTLCTSGCSTSCPLYNFGMFNCKERLAQDSLNLIKNLRDEIECQTATINHLNISNEHLTSEVERLYNLVHYILKAGDRQ